MIPYNICLSLTDSFHLAQYPLSPFKLLQMGKKCYFYGQMVFQCIYIYHIFFIHSFVGEHLGWFHILTVITNATINIEVHVSFWISNFVVVFLNKHSDIYPGVELLSCMVVIVLLFCVNTILLFKVVLSVYIPTNSEGKFPLCSLVMSSQFDKGVI